jgi:hypothetical protein
MREFLRNIIPRIQKYSKGLDKIEVFVDKTEPWIYVDDEGNQHQYIFMRDKRLIMSYNGIVKTGTWELLPTNQLLINRVNDEIILEHLFVNKDLLILKKTGRNDNPFILINKVEIPDLNVEQYLSELEKKKKERQSEYEVVDDSIDSFKLFLIGAILLAIFFMYINNK